MCCRCAAHYYCSSLLLFLACCTHLLLCVLNTPHYIALVRIITTISDVAWPDMSLPQPGVLPRDSFQNKRFKLIPSMVEAPWVVQMAVR